ncbi:MAG: ABC transporter permease subunit, partial [Hyphomicrobiales bacterium]|nr:ABC transporter permease subunit [Hyphomicrobiales bacterium]
AALIARWKFAARALYPLAVAVQVTPVVAVAPLLLVWLDPRPAELVCAVAVAFFPVLANAASGLSDVDPALVDLFRFHGASGGAEFALLRLRAALPRALTGLRIGGGLALVGAVVAEIAAGSGGPDAGLAELMVKAGLDLDVPLLFAALGLLAGAGLAIFALTSALERWALARFA